MSALLGIFLHAVGGFAAGSFYIPLKRVRDWNWESGWLVNGVAAWILLPMIVALLTVPSTVEVLGSAMTGERTAAGYTFLFGLLWGIGGLTFGLSIRYLGVALGTTVALGCCAAFGTLVPPLVEGRLLSLFNAPGGATVGIGLLLCFIGIALGGVAGRRRELETPETADGERNYLLGLTVAVISGVLSACFAFGLAAGGLIAELSIARGTAPLFQSSAVLVILLWGGFLTNALWCLWMNWRNGRFSDYTDGSAPLRPNYLWAALAGSIWYFQFMFYGMGSSYLGPAFDFASWSIHMAFIILFSNLWGLYFREWEGTSKGVRFTLYAALSVLLVSVVLIGLGSTGD
jgi:L-rhamnose-H+ transport protein